MKNIIHKIKNIRITLIIILSLGLFISCTKKSYYDNTSKYLIHDQFVHFKNKEFEECKNLYEKAIDRKKHKNYINAFECFHARYANAINPNEAAHSLYYKLKIAYEFKAYDYFFNNFLSFIDTYGNEYKTLKYDLLLTEAYAYRKQIKGIDRNVYPNARYVYIITDYLIDMYKYDKINLSYYIYTNSIKLQKEILDIMDKHEKYVMSFYKRTGHKEASKKRTEYSEAMTKLKNYKYDLFDNLTKHKFIY